MGYGHMWKDMGFASRAELRALLTAASPRVVARNVHDMRWKKFLYRELCKSEAGYVITSYSIHYTKLYEPSRVLRVNSTEEGRNTVARGRADVLLLALPSVRAMAGDGLEAVAARSDSPGDLPTHDIAFVFAPDQPALLRSYNFV